jgi:hypothetical protein
MILEFLGDSHVRPVEATSGVFSIIYGKEHLAMFGSVVELQPYAVNTR